MKRKSIVAILFVTLLLPVLMFTSCDQDKVEKPHEHTFAEEWTYDETHHWHKATCEHTDEVTDKAEHVVGSWTTETPAQENTPGKEKGVCTVCNAEVSREIPALNSRTITIKDESKLTKTYNGVALAFSKDDFDGVGEGEVTIEYKAKVAEDASYTTDAPKDAGEYNVRVSVPADATYAATTKVFDFKIGKIKIAEASIEKVYDGTGNFDFTISEGFPAGESCNVKIKGFKNKDVGDYNIKHNVDKANIEVSYLEGTNKDNYEIDIEHAFVVKAEITPIELDASYPFAGLNTLFVPESSEGQYVLFKIQDSKILQNDSVTIQSTNKIGLQAPSSVDSGAWKNSNSNYVLKSEIPGIKISRTSATGGSGAYYERTNSLIGTGVSVQFDKNVSCFTYKGEYNGGITYIVELEVDTASSTDNTGEGLENTCIVVCTERGFIYNLNVIDDVTKEDTTRKYSFTVNGEGQSTLYVTLYNTGFSEIAAGKYEGFKLKLSKQT